MDVSAGPAHEIWSLRSWRGRTHAHWVLLALALAAPFALLLANRLLAPDPRGFGTHEQLGLQPCWPMQHWGLPCPGCGVTTAVALFAHLHPLDAFLVQPLGFALALAAALAPLVALAAQLRARDLGHLVWQQSLVRLTALGLGFAALAWGYKIVCVLG